MDIFIKDEDILYNIDKAILVIPYSYFDDNIKSFNKDLLYNANAICESIVDKLIDNNIFALYICVYNVDNTRYKVNMSEFRHEIEAKTNFIVNTMFENIFEEYKNSFYAPSINGAYCRTSRSITKIVTKSNLFGSSKRRNIKFDSRSEDPILNDNIKKQLEGKLNNVGCIILSNGKDNDNGIIDKTLMDIVTYSFIPRDNKAVMIFK